MKIERTSEHNIIVLFNDAEIHPFVSVLAAIEMQKKISPPRIPELTSQGWDAIIEALKIAIDTLPELPSQGEETEEAEKNEASSVVGTDSVIDTELDSYPETSTFVDSSKVVATPKKIPVKSSK